VKILNPNFNFSENTKNRVNAEIGDTARKSQKPLKPQILIKAQKYDI